MKCQFYRCVGAVQCSDSVSWSERSRCWCCCPTLAGLLVVVWSLSRHKGRHAFQLGRCQRSTEVGNTRRGPWL